MRSRLRFLCTILVVGTLEPILRADGPLPSPSTEVAVPIPSLVTSPSPAKSFTAILARDPTGEPAALFATETPKIYLRWQGQSLNAGDKIRCIWIAEDVGKAAPVNYHVDEAVTTANESQTTGMFTLSKPKADWPEGKYRVEIYVGTELVAMLPFTIERPRGD
jgi:hypothetical protein